MIDPTTLVLGDVVRLKLGDTDITGEVSYIAGNGKVYFHNDEEGMCSCGQDCYPHMTVVQRLPDAERPMMRMINAMQPEPILVETS